MPTSSASLSELGVEAVTKGAQQAATSFIPDPVFHVFHHLLHADTMLTRPQEIKIFHELYDDLSPFCSGADAALLPECVLKCWSCFSYTVLRGNVYQFNQIVNLKKLRESYFKGAPIQGTVYRDYPLTGQILAVLSQIKSLEVDSKQTIAKMTLGYVGLVSLALAQVDNAVQQYDVVMHLKRIVNILIHEENYRAFFDRPALEALRVLDENFQAFLATPHPMRDAEFIPNAVQKFEKHQLALVSHLFKMLFILTEGGNKTNLTSDYKKIAQGQLEDNLDPKGFHESNPFQSMLVYAAHFIPELHQKFVRDAKIRSLSLPKVEDVEGYLEGCLDCGFHFLGRHAYSSDPILYLLEQKKEGHQVNWAQKTDRQTINDSAMCLRKIADWLRFHLYIADKIVSLKLLLSTEGQRWLAHGDEALFIQFFIQRYYEMLLEFQKDAEKINDYLNQRVRKGMNSEHGVLKITGFMLKRTIALLLEHAVRPLLDIENRFMRIADHLSEIRLNFFSEASYFLNNSGYGFNLPKIQASNSVSCSKHLPISDSTNTIKKQAWLDLIERFVLVKTQPNISKKNLAFLTRFWHELSAFTQLSQFTTYHDKALTIRMDEAAGDFIEKISILMTVQDEFADALQQQLDTINFVPTDTDLLKQKKRVLEDQKQKTCQVTVKKSHKLLLSAECRELLDHLFSHHPLCIEAKKRLNELLKQAGLQAGRSRRQTKAMQGLLMLGADPRVLRPLKLQERSTIIILQKTQIILTRLFYQSNHLGEVSVLLKPQLKHLFLCVLEFAARLEKAMASDDYFFWKILRFLGCPIPLGARNERMVLFWCVLDYLSVVLNEQLIESHGTCSTTYTEKILTARAAFEKACTDYEKVVKNRKRFYNQGTASFKKLKEAMRQTDSRLKVLGIVRKLKETLEEKNLMLEENTQLKRELEKSKTDKELAVQNALIETMHKTSRVVVAQLFSEQNFSFCEDRCHLFREKLTQAFKTIHSIFSSLDERIIRRAIDNSLLNDPAYKHVRDLLSSETCMTMTHPGQNKVGLFFEGNKVSVQPSVRIGDILMTTD